MAEPSTPLTLQKKIECAKQLNSLHFKQYWYPSASGCELYLRRKVILKMVSNGVVRLYNMGYHAVIILDTSVNYPPHSIGIDLRKQIQPLKHMMYTSPENVVIDLTNPCHYTIEPLIQPVVICLPTGVTNYYAPAGMINMQTLFQILPGN